MLLAERIIPDDYRAKVGICDGSLLGRKGQCTTVAYIIVLFLLHLVFSSLLKKGSAK